MEDKQKLAEFVSLAESGAIQAGLTQDQKNLVNKYVIDQRNAYVNAAMVADSPRFTKNSPAYIEAVSEMNMVKQNLVNIANQQKAITDNQQEYLDDYQSGRLSKANNYKSEAFSLADVYTGSTEMSIDSQGNLLFGKEGNYVPYSKLANYSLKATDTANSILNVVDDIYNSRYKLNPSSLKMATNKLNTIIEEAGRDDLISLTKDGLLPGWEDIEIPEEMFKPENFEQLKGMFLQTMDTALEDVNNQLPAYTRGRKTTSTTTTTTSMDPYTPAWMGITEKQGQAVYSKLKDLKVGEPFTPDIKMSLSTDAHSDRYGGQYFYTFEKASDGNYSVTSTDREGNKTSKPYTPEQLQKEFSFTTTQAAGGILAENSLDDL